MSVLPTIRRMKIIVSSKVLRSQLSLLFKHEVTNYRSVDDDSIHFLTRTIDRKVIYHDETIHCHVMEGGSGVFNERKWINLYKFLGNLSEQPITVEFDEDITITDFQIRF